MPFNLFPVLGCMNGGSVCSSVDYNMTTVCAQGQVNSPCQQVQRPVCYGDQGSCNYANQQCCVDVPQRVCQPVARRIPTPRYSMSACCQEDTHTQVQYVSL